MSVEKSIITKVSLDPSSLTKNLKNDLVEKLRSVLLNDCSKEHGYILKVIRLEEILDNTIVSDCAIYEDKVSSTCQLVFKVKVLVESLKPVEEQVYDAYVHGVLSHGVLVSVEGKMKVLIPDPIEGWTYTETALLDKYYQNVDDISRKIRTGDTVKIRLKGTKYRNKSYRSYGQLV